MGRDGANVDLICGLDQSRRDAAFQHDGQISNWPATVASSTKFLRTRLDRLLMICPSGAPLDARQLRNLARDDIPTEMRVTTVKKTTRANYRDAGEALRSEEVLFEKYADFGQTNARDTSAMIPQMLRPFDIHSQR